MSHFQLGPTSRARLKGVHPDLVRVVERAITHSYQDFSVLEGVRTIERQKELYAQGRTRPGKIVTDTMRSRHLTGHAVDLAPYPLDWNDTVAFQSIYDAMMSAARALGIEIRSGMDWDRDGKLREKGESDSPHFELPAGRYP